MFFFAAIASVAFASCTNDESVFDGAVNGNEINFAVAQYTPQTRADEHTTGAAFTGNVTIWSWYDGENTEVIPGDVYDPTSGTFPDSRKYYWPVNGQKLDFVAVPTELVGTAYFTKPGRAADGATALTFIVPGGNDYHGTNIMTTEVKTANSGTVALLFRHLLSKINIKVTQKVRDNADARWLVTINDIKVSGLKCAGQVAINDSWDATDGDKLWDSTDGSETWQVTDGDNLLYPAFDPLDPTLDALAAATPYTSAATYYMLPQILEGVKGNHFISGICLFILVAFLTFLLFPSVFSDYTIETDYLGNPTQPNTVETYSKTFDLEDVTAITQWSMNKVITYNISIDPSETLVPITFSVNEEVWGEVPGTAPDVIP